MPRQDREGNPERELELQVIEVFDPVRRKPEQHPAEHACRRRSRQLPHQHVRTDPAGGKRGNQRQVVDQQGVEPYPVKRCQRNAGQDPKGPGIREKSRGVWQTLTWTGYRDQMRDPREPPHRKCASPCSPIVLPGCRISGYVLISAMATKNVTTSARRLIGATVNEGFVER